MSRDRNERALAYARELEAADTQLARAIAELTELERQTEELRSRASSLEAFLGRYARLIGNCAGALAPGGRLAILMGDYSDREAGFVPLVYHTKRLCFEAGLRQTCTDIIRFSHGASSAKKEYRSSFIPGLHDVCTIVERAN